MAVNFALRFGGDPMILSAIAEKLVQSPRRCAVGHRKRVSRIIGLDLIPRLLGSDAMPSASPEPFEPPDRPLFTFRPLGGSAGIAETPCQPWKPGRSHSTKCAFGKELRAVKGKQSGMRVAAAKVGSADRSRRPLSEPITAAQSW